VPLKKDNERQENAGWEIIWFARFSHPAFFLAAELPTEITGIDE